MSSLKFEKITKCRICECHELLPLMDFGEVASCGLFLKTKNDKAPTGTLSIVFCPECTLVQLDRNFDVEQMFGIEYGYESSLNHSMKAHLERLVHSVANISPVLPESNVLDIGSNDGTLLNYLARNFETAGLVGVDPTINLFADNYDERIFKVNRLFSSTTADILIKDYQDGFDLITSVAMFYDLPDPNDFVEGIDKILSINGIWVIELSYLFSMIQENAIDTVCHEHLEYYSFNSIAKLLKRHDLKVFDYELNASNGGSVRLYISRILDSRPESDAFIRSKLAEPTSYLDIKSLFIKMISQINEQVSEAIAYLDEARESKGLQTYGLGASTKGNFFLQVFPNLSGKIKCIGEINKRKFNRFTPGTNIKIVDELSLFNLEPAIYVVFPWHFKDFLVKNYHDAILSENIILVFILPNFLVVGAQHLQETTNFLKP